MQWLGTLGQDTLAKDKGLWRSICPWGITGLNYYGTNCSIPLKQMIHEPLTNALALSPEEMKIRKAELAHTKYVELCEERTIEEKELSNARHRVSHYRHRSRTLARRYENQARKERGERPLVRERAANLGPVTIEELIAVGYFPWAKDYDQEVKEKAGPATKAKPKAIAEEVVKATVGEKRKRDACKPDDANAKANGKGYQNSHKRVMGEMEKDFLSAWRQLP